MKFAKLTKKQFEILIGVFGLLIGIGFLVLAERSSSHLFKIPVFKSIWMVLVTAWQFFWGFVKMFAMLFWRTVTSSWLSAIIIIGLIAFLVLGYFYRRRY